MRPGRTHMETQPETEPKRSFESIAQVLSDRYGAEVSSAEVERVCIRAQRKILRALLSDPELRQVMIDAA
ncbi:MAG: hypothetical protein IT430_17520 [Phycisphaerales bacterium]|nr:hypothetical protein [Phycisphaerales bacterium]